MGVEAHAYAHYTYLLTLKSASFVTTLTLLSYYLRQCERFLRGLVICELRTGNMRTNMRTRPLIGRDVTRVPRAVRKVQHGVRSSHCFVSRPHKPYCSIAESRCICIIFMTTVFGQLFVSVS